MKCSHILGVVAINCIVMMQMTLLAAILPLEVKRRHISQTITGVIMSAFCFFVPAFTVEKLFPKLGRRGSVQTGTLLLSVTVLIYGLEYYIPDDQRFLFSATSILARFFEGVGCAIARTSIASLINKLYPEELGLASQARVLGVISGFSLGVILGSAL